MSIQAADALMQIFGFHRVAPVKVQWSCEQHDAGWLVIAAIGETAFAHHVTKDDFKDAHEPDWFMQSVIRGLARNVKNFEDFMYVPA